MASFWETHTGKRCTLSMCLLSAKTASKQHGALYLFRGRLVCDGDGQKMSAFDTFDPTDTFDPIAIP